MIRVFVAGGAGGVGEGIVHRWLGEGAAVVTLSRSEERRQALREAAAMLPGKLEVLEGSSSDASRLDEIVKAHGPFDHAVASVGGGGWKLAPLVRMDASMFRRVVEDGISAHWEVARVLLPLLRPKGSYVFINGGAALHIVPGTGPLSVVARAQLALADVFRAELPAHDAPRVTSLILATPISTKSRGDRVKPEWLTPEDVGEACVRFALGDSTESQIVLGGKRDAL